MSYRNIILGMLVVSMMLFAAGCTEPKPVVTGGIAVGISPKLIHADKGGNISFTVDMLSTENADDRVTIEISAAWIKKTLVQDIKAGSEVSVPVYAAVPMNAENTTITVRALSRNLNAASSTTGYILVGSR